MDDDPITIANYGSRLEAELARGRLETAGIKAASTADSAGGMVPSLATATGGYELIVAGTDASRAIEVLEAIGSDPDPAT